MMMLSDVAKIVEGQILGKDAVCKSVGSDSRFITKGELFFALKGDHFDGHTYAEQAIQQGASAVVISDKNCEIRPAILVKDTLLALGDLAKNWRNHMNIALVAVTGSNGKTTVKEMLSAILVAAAGNHAKVHATAGNLNNHIGMPMTLLKLNKEHAFAVIEMGMNHLNEIDYLTRIAQPNVAVITNAGTAHIGELGSRDNIAKAKGEIFAGLNKDGIAVINADDSYAEFWKKLNIGKKIITFGLTAKADVTASYEDIDGISQISLTTPAGNIGFKLEMLGKHNISNALAASACAVALSISNADIAAGLSNMHAVKGRLQRKNGINGAHIIDDTYNANPDSMKAAIDVLAAQPSKQVFVMGDMAELGRDSAAMHAGIGAYAKQKGIDALLGFGEQTQLAVQAFGQHGEHFDALEANIHAACRLAKKDVTILVKGSRFMQMERVVAALEEKIPPKKLLEDE